MGFSIKGMIDAGYNAVGKVVKASAELGDSLQKSAKSVVNGFGLVGGGAASAAVDVKSGVPKPAAVANAVKGAGIGMVGELAARTVYDVGKKVYNYFSGSK